MASIPCKVNNGNYIITSCLVNKCIDDNYCWVNWGKHEWAKQRLYDVHGICHSACSFVGHNLCGQKDSNWQAEVMVWVFLVQSYYTDDSQANSYKHLNKHMKIIHQLVCWKSYDMILVATYWGCLHHLLAKECK